MMLALGLSLLTTASGGGSGTPNAPVNVTPASISIGDGLVGTTAVATPGAWTDADTVTGQWQTFDGSWGNIIGAMALEHEITANNAGKNLRYLETAMNAGDSTSEPSNAEAVPYLSAPTFNNLIIEAPSGLKVGALCRLHAGSPDFSVSANPPVLPEDVSWQWQRNSADIAGANNPSAYYLTEADADAPIRLQASATNSQGATSYDSNDLTALPLEAPNATGITPTASRTSGILHCDAPLLGNEPAEPQFEWYLNEPGVGADFIGDGNDYYYPDYIDWPTKYVYCLVTWTNSQGSDSAQSNNVIA
jgi:hypothetical protein